MPQIVEDLELSHEHAYATIPASVLEDNRLTDSDLRVYGAMATLERDHGLVRAGVRLIAKYACKSRPTTARAILKLINLGHAKRAGFGKHGRHHYQLTDPIFQRKTHMAPCIRCQDVCKLNLAGYCRRCAGQIREERRQTAIAEYDSKHGRLSKEMQRAASSTMEATRKAAAEILA